MNILLTGATGLLGSVVLPALKAQHTVSVISSVEQSNSNFTEINWIKCDLSRGLDLRSLPEHIDAVVHLAQSRLYKSFPENMLAIYEINVGSMAKLLDYAYHAGAKSFLYTSTGSVYYPYQGTLSETQLLDPIDFYANSKLAAERLALSFSGYFSICIFRLFFLYGSVTNYSLIATLIAKIKNKQPVIIDGDDEGLVFTPTLNIDVAGCIVQAINSQAQGIYNVSGTESISIKSLALKIGEILKIKPVFKYEIKVKPFVIKPNLEKINSSSLALPFTSLDDGLRMVLE